MLKLIRMVVGSCRKRGLWNTLCIIVGELSFDLCHGMDSGGVIPLDELEVKGGNRAYGSEFQAVSVVLFKRVFGCLRREHGLEPRTALFVDFGSGKGRALVLALAEGFLRVLGVEFSGQLVDICRANFAKLKAAGKLPIGARYELRHEDAVECMIPDEAGVFFLFNPFGPPIIDHVAENIACSACFHPRQIFVAYFNPLHQDAFEKRGFVPILNLLPDAIVYKYNAPLAVN